MTPARPRLALVLLALLALLSAPAFAQSTTDHFPLLLRSPSLSQDKVAFRYADDIWTVSRQGGEAERLTSNGKVVAGPFFSPDGSQIAYSAHLNGNDDVIRHSGKWRRSAPHHLASGRQRSGWLVARWQERPDRQRRAQLSPFPQAFPRPRRRLGRSRSPAAALGPLKAPTRPTANPWPTSRSPSGSRRGSATWAARPPPSGSSTSRPSTWSRCRATTPTTPNPVWVGNSVYFLSDRNGPVSLFRYDIGSKQVSQVVPNSELRPQVSSGGPRRAGL